MDIQAEINWIHQEIDKVKDPSFVEKLKHLLQSINNTSVDSDASYNLDIENALNNIKKGNFYTEDEAKEIAKKWGRK
ncbi:MULTISPECIES: hypothetical protein [Flavobacterium]|jgi:hypothetical protein|uniref:Uncharacterized protein n=2 Tax=Flavobacterium johnsoniae TaxID=986 RepID=A0A1M5P537_FLAJO|nr:MULTISPECIES: hypothetical protein [Flavobacterium]ABQ05515.1 hypothetical protein Fjoh_2488 [Flavobacterium johnsoniae UW101]OXE96756.1 hypothetical protein B0A63_19825 [Flavobacterium johnsoniae UW101]WDF61211.1 hypothetical protein PQ462_07525 [Flavobacterium sp. KACC 22758]WQG82683.1 hypothetical protein SR927_06085 [Flavobacterium johnsoniae UW101]SHG96797.1 hypothetical protein SAMN05444388_105234 [Flavobacterium johnsoniae]